MCRCVYVYILAIFKKYTLLKNGILLCSGDALPPLPTCFVCLRGVQGILWCSF